MKFSFFHLMPYPYLPDDFDTAYDSSALTYPNANFDPAVGTELYAQYLDELEYADRLGFDGIADLAGADHGARQRHRHPG